MRQIVCCWLAFYMFFCFGMPAQVVLADTTPVAGTLPSGVIDRTGIDAPVYTTGRMDMTQTAGEAIVNWNNFDIGTGATVEFHQPTTSAAVLNRVHDGFGTGIMGTLAANGRVFIVNPAGIVFGGGAAVNVAQLVASALPMSDTDFLNAVTDPGAKMVFGPGGDDVTINMGGGTLNATGTDSLYFVGSGSIERAALVVMVAADAVLLGQPGSDVIVELADLTADELNVVDNTSGTVGGSQVDKLVLAAGDVWSQAIGNSSEVRKVEIAVKGSIDDGDLDEIYAYSDGGSDAVADVTITSGGDITVDDQIMAEADADGDGDNSFASVTIESTGGYVDIDALVKAEADAEDGAGNATATVDIIADGYVDIQDGAEGEDVQADVWVVDSGDGTATVNITAGGYVDISGYIKAEAEGDNSGDMSATVDILSTIVNAGEGVWVYDDAEVLANAEAENGSGNATANVLIEATGGLVDISDNVKAEADAEGDSGNAT
ncbi:MAG: two-partner secretion domain-containing protein, partial [Planctomycetota bacterium]